jgi:hypothetical protein
MEMLKSMLANNQEQMNANNKRMLAEMTKKIDANQAKADKTLKKTLAKMEAD